MRAGQSRVLVMRGEAGAGKTALLQYLVQGSAGCRIVRAVGAEPEKEMAFAGLYQLCAPFLDRLRHLPAPQRDALGTAFHLRDGSPPDRFAAGVAVLSLLSEAAADGPLLCLVDDAQWLDPNSVQALAFVARHLAAAPVAMVLALRQPGGEHELTGLPELPVGGLADGDAHELLDSHLVGPIDERVRNRIAADAHGNPAALLELQRMLTPGELAGGFALPTAVPLSRRVQEDYRRQLVPLPPATRLLLLIAAAELTADPILVWRAAGRLDIEAEAAAEAAAPAIAAGLIGFGGQVRFCHPLARVAIYQAASLQERQGVHHALADVTDPSSSPELRAWHRAHTTTGFDEDIAASLEHSSARAQGLGGLAAAAAFGERAVELTPEPARRARRALAAARTEHQAGAPDAALRLLAVAQAGPLDDLEHARAELLRAQVAAGPGRDRDAWQLLIKAAKRLEQVDAGMTREALRDAFTTALAAGRLGLPGGIRQVADVALAVSPASRPLSATDLLLDGLALLITDGPAAGTPLVKRAIRAFCNQENPAWETLPWLLFACRLSRTAWDDESWDVLSARLIEVARHAGG